MTAQNVLAETLKLLLLFFVLDVLFLVLRVLLVFRNFFGYNRVLLALVLRGVGLTLELVRLCRCADGIRYY